MFSSIPVRRISASVTVCAEAPRLPTPRHDTISANGRAQPEELSTLGRQRLHYECEYVCIDSAFAGAAVNKS